MPEAIIRQKKRQQIISQNYNVWALPCFKKKEMFLFRISQVRPISDFITGV